MEISAKVQLFKLYILSLSTNLLLSLSHSHSLTCTHSHAHTYTFILSLLPQVVVPLYHAAFRFNTPKLLASCCHYLLSHYHEVSDPDHEALLHVLDNTPARPNS